MTTRFKPQWPMANYMWPHRDQDCYPPLPDSIISRVV